MTCQITVSMATAIFTPIITVVSTANLSTSAAMFLTINILPTRARVALITGEDDNYP